MKAAPKTFLNEGENKRRGIEIRTTCVKKKKRMDEMKAEKGEINNE